MLPFILVAALTQLNQPLDFDEGDYHIPVVHQFAETLPAPDLVHYESATTPLMHLTLAAWSLLVGDEVWKLRLPVLLAGMLTVLVFYRLVQERGDACPLRTTLFLVAYPYAFWLSFLVMTEVFALLFGVLALRHFLRRNSARHDLVLFAVWSTLAVLSRQQWLILPVGAGLYWLWTDRGIKRAVWAALPVLAFLPFAIAWGGAAPPLDFATSHDLALNPVQVPMVLIAAGFYFAGALPTAPIPWRKLALPVLLVLPFFLVAPQLDSLPSSWMLVPEQRVFAGLLAQLGGLAERFALPVLVHLGYLALFVVGVLLVGQAWLRRRDDDTLALWFVAIPGFLLLLTVAQAWERYLLPLAALGILIFYAPNGRSADG